MKKQWELHLIMLGRLHALLSIRFDSMMSERIFD